jgi:hypothetical protein
MDDDDQFTEEDRLWLAKQDDATRAHVREVQEWLDTHVQDFPEAKRVKLYDFFVDWDRFSGDFRLAIDDVIVASKITFGLDASGKARFYYPMFGSVLGAPASFAAINLTPNTEKAILKGLQETIPPVMGAGINRETGQSISYHTPPNERIDPQHLLQAINRINDQYSIVVTLPLGSTNATAV